MSVHKGPLQNSSEEDGVKYFSCIELIFGFHKRNIGSYIYTRLPYGSKLAPKFVSTHDDFSVYIRINSESML